MSAFEGGPLWRLLTKLQPAPVNLLHIGAHIEVGEIATVLDLRFADGTVERVRQQGSTSVRQTPVRGQLQ
jgi:hypothetical protein